ncbi:hypothetical protein [Streptomyces fulvoviolaceus]|nr:hypothetical protein [Streptomyces fulvoviolaceus]MCT9082993.1 hypothetical protein [Streptomyces fulvoviolaceus]
MRARTAVVASRSSYDRSSYDVILVSSSVRCPLRGRHRMPATSI